MENITLIIGVISAILGIVSVTCVIIINMRTIKKTNPALEQARAMAEWQKGVEDKLDRDHTRLQVLEKRVEEQLSFERIVLRSVKGIFNLMSSSHPEEEPQVKKLIDDIDHYLIER